HVAEGPQNRTPHHVAANAYADATMPTSGWWGSLSVRSTKTRWLLAKAFSSTSGSLAPPAPPNPILQAARQVVCGLLLSGGVRGRSRSIPRLKCRLGSGAVAFLCRSVKLEPTLYGGE